MRTPVSETARSRSQACKVTVIQERGPTAAGGLDNVGDVCKRLTAEPTPCYAFIHDANSGRGKEANYMITVCHSSVAGHGKLRLLMISRGHVLQ